jgi:DNA-binding SARP family transcriptional activator
VQVNLFGGFEVWLNSAPIATLPKKVDALLAYLALNIGRSQMRDKLAALLWGEAGDIQARNSLRQAFFVLRQKFGAAASATPPILLTAGETVTLNPDAVDVDAVKFQLLIAEGTPNELQGAVNLYKGDLLEGLNVTESPFEQWLLVQRERLRELATDALTQLLAFHMSTASSEAAIQTAVQLLAFDPLQESVHRSLMRLYADQERWGAVQRQYRVCLETLKRELDVPPAPQTTKLWQDILQQRKKAC